MKPINPVIQIINATPDLELTIEEAGRVCYKSEDRICEGSAAAFIGRLQESKHESVLEHAAITVKFICDRGVSHEIVRHRIASYSQESTRYCNYTKGKFGAEITVIDISTGFKYDMNTENDRAKYAVWQQAMINAENSYNEMVALGATPQEARSVLPNSLKTEVVMTANPREWLHFFRMRTSIQAHPQMREVAIPLQVIFRSRWPAIFGVEQ